MKYNRILVLISFLFIIFASGFVLAAPTAPSNLIFNNNATVNYDEGSFFFNWTLGGGEVEANYTIYLFSNNTLYTTSSNGSSLGYTFSNTTEANYTFVVEAVNATGTGFNSTTNISIYVDSSAPVISLPVYTNLTVKKNSTTLTLNISISDGLSGVIGTACLVDVNGTNQTISYSGGWCNGTVGLLGLTDGNHSINIYANDTVNNFGLNNSFVVQSDTTIPTASASCTPSNVYTMETIECTCSGTDVTSGVASSSASSTPSTVNFGTFSYSCTVTDNAGNSQSTTATYIVTSRGSSSSSTTTNEWAKQKIVSLAKIVSGSASIIEDFDSGIGIKQIEINVNNESQNVKFTIRKYNSKPTEVSVSKTGKVYQYLQIKVDNLGDKLDNAKISIRVEKSWVIDNSLSKEEVALFKFSESSGIWNELLTVYSEEDNTYYYYDAEVNSFSYFVIGEKVLVENGSSTGEEETLLQGEELLLEEANGSWSSWILWVIGGIVILIIVYLFFVRKKGKLFK